MPETIERHSLSDAEILRSVEQTVREVLLPALPEDGDWARTASVQLIGLVRYALRRGPDRSALYRDELLVALDSLSSNGIVSELWNGSRTQADVLEATGAVLARSASDDSPDSLEVRNVLRPIVIGQVDQELAETSPLVNAFRGKLDDV